ncbi:DNA topoisomerase I [Candidatus Woesearchaeota archaeon]|nr:DNA topoisomerase I [Candidatus Woesearchaeota archaeon]
MPYELIICEKPSAAKKMADALAEGKAIKQNSKERVPYYEITRGKKDIVVVPAVGHLYGIAEKEKKGWTFPVFDIEWKPSSEVNKKSDFSKKYLSTIKRLAKGADEFTVACDYDQEGSVIGRNIVEFACKQKDANRMKFSTLTKPDLIEAYEHKAPHLDWGQINAGDTRHRLDFFNGINYSRALTSSIKTAGSFKIMSTGRVQGPSLKIIVDREKEIKAFKPVPFWQIELNGTVNTGDITAWHQKDKFWDKKDADKVMEKVKDEKKAVVDNTKKKQFKQMPPVPFDLTTLQTESYRCYRIQPKETLALAQELYTSGLVSYPRTSSQKLDPKIGFRTILGKIGKQKNYFELTSKLLANKVLKPNDGKKIDPAHPAIYPTGVEPKALKEHENKVYDLIVKRFMATFAEHALRQTMTVDINCKEEIFIAKGTTTIEKGWHVFYEPYVKLEEEELPEVNKGDDVGVRKIQLHDKETQPPKRYTPSSIIRALEKKNLGTKATRANIVDTLFQRGYVDGKAIQATELGIRTLETLEKYTPKIVEEELTRHFEEEMEKVREGKVKKEQILEEAKVAITKIIKDFKKHEGEIGKELLAANNETRDEMSTLGKCPSCKKGDLQIRKGKYGRFVACNQYPKCKTTFSLPSNALIKPAKKMCEDCGYPKLAVIKKGKQPLEVCLNKECKSKHIGEEAWKEAKEIKNGNVEKECPKCKEGKIVLRSSIYGKFLACDKFPKCKYTEKLENDKSKEDFGKEKSN